MLSTPNDDFLWLEDIRGTRPLEWVEGQNALTEGEFRDARTDALAEALRAALDDDAKIPFVSKIGDWYYSFWQDAEHPRGLWRRTTWESYAAGRTDPAATEWHVLLDVDALAKAEDVEWVFRGATIRRSDWRRALVALSPDGGDAVEWREFDVEAAAFVTESPLHLPAAKSSAAWVDDDTLVITTDFGAGSLTASSYPAQVRILSRGQALEDAEQIAEVDRSHVLAVGAADHTPGFERLVFADVIDFFNAEVWIRPLDGSRDFTAGWQKIDVPTHVSVDIDRDLMLLRPREDWHGTSAEGDFHVPSGALAAVRLEDFLAGRPPVVIFTPTDSTSLQGWSVTRDFIALALMEHVQSTLRVLRLSDFSEVAAPAVPAHHTVDVSAVDPDDDATANDVWVTLSGFLTPTTLARGELGSSAEPAVVRRSPERFDAAGLAVSQHFATSDDGTRVPYFQVGPADLPCDGRNPVFLDGYGGFEVSRTPGYALIAGLAWLTQCADGTGDVPAGRRGVYVLANIRGGGEYGPAWHMAAVRQNKQRSYEDFAAVARDLVDRGVATAQTIGASGGSNGGLLVGNMLTQHPELFGAISCGVPLLDMRRYTQLSAGASWIAEYGDPDTDDWEFIQHFSPYHLLDSAPKDDYPPVLFWTATSDDRVGPVQARKMAAKMQARAIPDVWFFEDTEGGHSAASDNRQLARTRALVNRFLWRVLTGEDRA